MLRVLFPRVEADADVAVGFLRGLAHSSHFGVAGRQPEGEDLQHAPDAHKALEQSEVLAGAEAQSVAKGYHDIGRRRAGAVWLKPAPRVKAAASRVPGRVRVGLGLGLGFANPNPNPDQGT